MNPRSEVRLEIAQPDSEVLRCAPASETDFHGAGGAGDSTVLEAGVVSAVAGV